MFRGFLRPGQGFKKYKVLRKKNGVNESGRVTKSELTDLGELIGIISQASQKEKEQWKQSGHPITHKVVQRGSPAAKPTDILLMDGTDRRFLVQGVHDPAELGHFTSYFVEEREDLQ